MAAKRSMKAFPYEECRDLAALRNESPTDLITSLDWYLSMIAGVGSHTSFSEKPVEQINRYINFLSKGFFEYFPQLEWYSPHISFESVPKLYVELANANALRLELLKLLSILPHTVEQIRGSRG